MVRTFFKSLQHALNGLRQIVYGERNFTIQIIAAFLAIALSILLQTSDTELMIVVICIALVISLEIVNSAVEKLCDFVQPDHDEKIKVIKDLAAAAVLVSTLAALFVGLIIFIPKFVELLFN